MYSLCSMRLSRMSCFRYPARAARSGTARLDVLPGERLREERIVEQVDLPYRQIVGGAPPRIDRTQVRLRRSAAGSLPGFVER